MSVIMRRTFPSPKGEKETLEPIEYIDSIVESSYIKAITGAAMKKMRELVFELKVLGSLDAAPHMVKSEAELATKDEGYWIINTSSPDEDGNVRHSLTLFQKIKYPAWLGLSYSYETRKVCEFYTVKCKRTVPIIDVKPTKFELFEDELKAAVSGFRANAERNGVFIANGKVKV